MDVFGVIGSVLLTVPVVTAYEPRPALNWSTTTQGQCNSNVLSLSEYGNSTRPGAVPSVVVNGEPVVGKDVGRLIRDLSNKRAVYRITILCLRAGDMLLRIYEGEGLGDDQGGARYRSTRAVIRGRTLLEYPGLQQIDANGFWFR